MANLTISVDEDTLRRARLRATEQGTSVNALLRGYLDSYAGESEGRRALEALVKLARSSGSGSGKRGRAWRREDLHER